MNNKRTIFITGATGLVGSYLLKTLLLNGHKVYALARNADDKSAEKRILEILRSWDEKISTEKLRIIEGDITKDSLDLDEKTRELLKNEIEEIFHAAAITDLNQPMAKMRKVNVEGTRNVLDLAKEFSKIVKINHISTAYIYGDYNGLFKESDLDVGQKLYTNYEETKFRAEQLVEEYRKKGFWVDIYRPSIVVGDSKNGKTFQFKHIYQFISLCELEIFDTLPILDAYVSLEPVDLLAEAIYIISINTKDKNRNYHPFPKKLIRVEDIINIASQLLNFKKPKIVSLEDFKIERLTASQRAILKNSILSVNLKKTLDSNYTNAILSKLDFKFPDIDNGLIAKILKYFVSVSRQNRVRNEINF
ncbi:MAG: SDR family oxidoreductase [Candidatus Omnitrophica bacterium]|nr:SDR family oxidoreductase [Candidatus Omnitrophota bacterium]MDD5237577.1 SDR family oxidoreductase [Candidatus Omnitrophota bacterium]